MIRKTVFVMVVLAFLLSTAQAKQMDVVTADGMTAGGYLYDSSGNKLHHTFQIDCDGASQGNLKADWGNNVFTLDALPQPTCINNTISGIGTGTLNGVPGATIVFSFTDNGEPGTNDYGMIDINGIMQAYGNLEGGNYQLHN